MKFKTKISHILTDLIKNKYPQLNVKAHEPSRTTGDASIHMSIDSGEDIFYIASIFISEESISICSVSSLIYDDSSNGVSIYDPNSIQIIEDSLDIFINRRINFINMLQSHKNVF